MDGNQDKLFELIQKANKQQTLELKDECRDIIKEINDKLDATNKEVDLLKLRCLKIERNSRRNNIIVFGMKASNEKLLPPEVITKLNELLKIQLRKHDIGNIFKLGKTDAPTPFIHNKTYDFRES